MHFSKRHALLLSVVGIVSSQASAQLRIVNYNTLDSPTGPDDANHAAIFSAIATQSVNGITRRPDLVILQEQTTASATAVASILNASFGVSTYNVSVPTGQSNLDRQAFVYNAASLTLTSSVSVFTAYRPVIRGQFNVVGYQNASFTAYGLHLMSSDPIGRAAQTAAMRANSDSFGSINAIYAGDYNVDSSDELSYQNVLTPGIGAGFDPLNQPGIWASNPSFAAIHTQSTRIDSINNGAGGGVDDRFDIQLATAELMDNDGLAYIGPNASGAPAHSYRTFGNVGTTYNKNINDPVNTSQPIAVLNALYNASDHLPVVADYQLPAKLSVTSIAQPSVVIEGFLGTYQLTISNSAPVTSIHGADELDFAMSATGATTSSSSGTVNATQSTVRSVPYQATVLGARQTNLNVTTSSQEAEGSFTSTHNYNVLRHASGSLAQNAASTTLTIDFGIVSIDAASAQKNFTIFNRAPAGASAGLDLDSVTLAGSNAFSTSLNPLVALPAGQSITRIAYFDPQTLGTMTASITIQTSDENLPGATSLSALALTLTVIAAIPGDANLDQQVAFADLLRVSQNYGAIGSFGWMDGDFTGDGAINFSDLLVVSQNYGRTASSELSFSGSDLDVFNADWARAQTLVPEPSVCGLIGISSLTALRRSIRQRKC